MAEPRDDVDRELSRREEGETRSLDVAGLELGFLGCI